MSQAAPSLAPQYWALTKPRVVALIVFTAIIGMLLAIQPGDEWPWLRLLAGSTGIWLAAASAAAINHLLDQRIDKVMVRTADRPLATGTLRPMQVLAFATVLGVASMAILLLWVNPITALLTFASLIGYAFVYTGFLKRATPQNIVIGGIAGAAPPLLGWATVTGMQGARDWEYALLLVLIIFVWTPPHFWALAIFRREDYARALVLGAVFLWYAWKLLDPPDEFFAMRAFKYSIVYLMALFAFLLVDHWLLPFLQPVAGVEFVPQA